MRLNRIDFRDAAAAAPVSSLNGFQFFLAHFEAKITNNQIKYCLMLVLRPGEGNQHSFSTKSKLFLEK